MNKKNKQIIDLIVGLFKDNFHVDVDPEDITSEKGTIEKEAVNVILQCQYNAMSTSELHDLKHLKDNYIKAKYFLKNYRKFLIREIVLIAIVIPLSILTFTVINMHSMKDIIYSALIYILIIVFTIYYYIKLKEMRSQLLKMKAQRIFYKECVKLNNQLVSRKGLD